MTLKLKTSRTSLSDTNPAIRRKTVFTFQKNPEKYFDLLCMTAKGDSSPVIRHEAIFLLGTIKDKKVVRLLLWTIAHDVSDLVRHEAIEMLGDCGFKTRSVIEALKKPQQDRNPFIRDTADIALATLELSKT